jgi:Mn-dependent DtxR family transcriptional regulator
MSGNEEVILEAMKKEAKPMRPGEIAEVAGIGKDEVSKALKELQKKGLINSPKRCFYAPIE